MIFIVIYIHEYCFFFAYLQYMENSAISLLFAGCRYYDADDFSEKCNFNIVYQFIIVH